MHLTTFRQIALCILLVAGAHAVTAQTNADSMAIVEETLDTRFGVDKLVALNQLATYYSAQNSRRAIRYGKQAVALGETLFTSGSRQPDRKDLLLLIDAYNQLGENQYNRNTYFEARRNFELAHDLSGQLADIPRARLSQRYLNSIDSLVADGTIKENFFSRTFSNAGIGDAITGAAQMASIETEILQGQSREKKGDFEGAIEHYTNASNQLRNTGKVERISEVQIRIAAMMDSLGRHEESKALLEGAIGEVENAMRRSARTLEVPATLEVRPGSGVTSNEDDQAEMTIDFQQEKLNLKAISQKLASEQDFAKSIAYYDLYQQLSQRMYEDSLQSAVEREGREREIMLLSQQKQIADFQLKEANAEKAKQNRLRKNLVLISLFILLICLVIFYFYVTKRKEHGKLIKAYDELDHTKTQLETAEKRIVRLLSQQVSGDIANELLANHGNELGERRFVCIMFLDIRGFSAMAETMSPEELIIYQNSIFGLMIDTIQQHHGIINQLLGDGFMATFGAPVSHGNDCQNAFNAAKEVLQILRQKIDAGAIPPTRVGIGLHAGYVVTGNVGSEKRKQYSITGNTVIIASRVEQLNKEYKSQFIITEDVYNQLDKPLKLDQPFLEVTVKGRTQPVKVLKIA